MLELLRNSYGKMVAVLHLFPTFPLVQICGASGVYFATTTMTKELYALGNTSLAMNICVCLLYALGNTSLAMNICVCLLCTPFEKIAFDSINKQLGPIGSRNVHRFTIFLSNYSQVKE